MAVDAPASACAGCVAPRAGVCGRSGTGLSRRLGPRWGIDVGETSREQRLEFARAGGVSAGQGQSRRTGARRAATGAGDGAHGSAHHLLVPLPHGGPLLPLTSRHGPDPGGRTVARGSVTQRLLASDGSVCTLDRLLTVPWVRVVRSDVTSVAWENTAVLHFVYNGVGIRPTRLRRRLGRHRECR